MANSRSRKQIISVFLSHPLLLSALVEITASAYKTSAHLQLHGNCYDINTLDTLLISYSVEVISTLMVFADAHKLWPISLPKTLDCSDLQQTIDMRTLLTIWIRKVDWGKEVSTTIDIDCQILNIFKLLCRASNH